MAKESGGTPPGTPPKERKVVCPECDTTNDLEQVDECTKCGLDLEKLYTQLRYRRALKKLEDAAEKEVQGSKKKKRDFDPF